MQYTNNKLIDNKNDRKLIEAIKTSGEHYPDIVNSFEKQLKTKRMISEKQFKVLLSLM